MIDQDPISIKELLSAAAALLAAVRVIEPAATIRVSVLCPEIGMPLGGWTVTYSDVPREMSEDLRMAIAPEAEWTRAAGCWLARLGEVTVWVEERRGEAAGRWVWLPKAEDRAGLPAREDGA